MDPELAAALRLQKLPDGRYRGTHAGGGGGRVVFGGQLLAQIVMAAADAAPDKSVKSVQVIFVRGASLDEPVTLEAELMHAGRLYTSATVSVRQGARLCVRALVLLDRADVELARHGPAMPAVGGPDASSRAVRTTGGAEMRIVGDVDLDDPAATGPPELAVWVRFDAVPSGDAIEPGAARLRLRALLLRDVPAASPGAEPGVGLPATDPGGPYALALLSCALLGVGLVRCSI